MKTLPLLLISLLCLATGSTQAQQPNLPDPMQGPATSAGYYYKNQGQIIDENGIAWPSIKYYSEKGRARLFFAPDKVYHTLRIPGDSVGGTLAPDTGLRLDVRFDCLQWREGGAQYCGDILTYEQSPDFLNYFLPHCGTGITDVVGWKTVMYQNAFPGVDVRYTGDAGGPVMYFVVHPGANPADIRLVMAGQDSLLQYVGGSLRAALGQQSIVFPMGTVYQIDGSGNPYVVPSWFATWYEINDSTVGLNTGSYNTGDALVIKIANPPVVAGTTAQGQDWGTYYDGNGNYLANAANIAVERYDLNIPASTPPLATEAGLFSAQAQHTNNFPPQGSTVVNAGLADVYLSKFNGDYVRQWATYYGGDADDVPTGIALDSGKLGGFYIVGSTGYINSPLPIPSSNNGIFYQSQGPGFIGKFNKLNGIPTWISKIDGGKTRPEAVDIDFVDDKLYVVGQSQGYGGTAFPTPLAGFLPVGNNSGQTTRYHDAGSLGGIEKGFVMEFNTANNSLNWSTFLGSDNRLTAVKKWNNGTDKRLWVGGFTINSATGPSGYPSPQTGITSFGVMPLANPLGTSDYFQTTLAATPSTENLEGYLAAFDAGFSLEWATYFGGDKNDVITSLALAPNGDLLVAGTTQTYNAAASSQAANNNGQFPLYDDPATNNYFNGAHASYAAGYPARTDDFLARFSPGYQLQWSTYFGGAGSEGGGPSSFQGPFPGSPALGAPVIATDALGNTILGSTTQTLPLGPSGGSVPTNFPVKQLGTNIYYQPDHSSASDPFVAKDCYFAMFGPANEQRWTTHFGGDAGPGVNTQPNPNPNSPDRADEVMGDVAVLSGQRIFGFLTTQSAITPTQPPATSSTGVPYFDFSLGGPNGDPFLTAFKYAQYTTSVAQGPGNGADALGLTASPNPADDDVRVQFFLPAASAVTLTLSDATGRTIFSRSVKGREGMNRTAVDLKGVTSGLYFIQLSTATGHEAIKIVKQ